MAKKFEPYKANQNEDSDIFGGAAPAPQNQFADPEIFLQAPTGETAPVGPAAPLNASLDTADSMTPINPADSSKPNLLKDMLTPTQTDVIVGKMLMNAPGDALDVGKGLVNMAVHPVDTAKALGAVAYGGTVGNLLEKWGVTDPNKQLYDQFKQSLKDEYGGWEQIKNRITTKPVSSIADLSTILTGMGGGLKLASVLPKMEKATTFGDIALKAGQMTDPLSMAIAGANKLNPVPRLAREITGSLTGTGPEAIATGGMPKTQYNGPFRQAMTGAIDERDIVNRARTTVQNNKDAATAAYTRGMEGVNGSTVPIDKAPIVDNYLKRMTDPDGYGVKVTPDPTTGELVFDYSMSPALADDATRVEALYKKLSTFGNAGEPQTAAGFDKLKQFTNKASPHRGTAFDKLAGDTYNDIKQSILTASPEYGKVMTDFAEASKARKDIISGLSLGDKTQLETTFKKLQSTMRENMGMRKAVLDTLDDPELSQMIAGQMFNKLIPRGVMNRLGAGAVGGGALHFAGMGALGYTAAAAVAVGSSPRLVGEFLNTLGYSKAKIAPVLEYGKKLQIQRGMIPASQMKEKTNPR